MRRTRSFLVGLTGALLLSVSAQATVYQATMTGAQEVPPNGSLATGFVTVTVLADTLTVDLSFQSLTNVAAAGHIHCCVPLGTNAIVAVPITGLPAATSGVYSNTFNLLDASIYNPAFLNGPGGGSAAGAEAALIAGLDGHMAYANIHDSPNFLGGEIRGNLAPEPATALLVLAGMLGIGRRRMQSQRASSPRV